MDKTKKRCECGKMISVKNYVRHRSRKYHQLYLKIEINKLNKNMEKEKSILRRLELIRQRTHTRTKNKYGPKKCKIIEISGPCELKKSDVFPEESD